MTAPSPLERTHPFDLRRAAAPCGLARGDVVFGPGGRFRVNTRPGRVDGVGAAGPCAEFG